MIDSVTRITLNLQDTNTLVCVKAKRGDTGRKLLIHLSDGSIPYPIAPDCYAVFTARKSDGTKLHHPCGIENNVVIYTFTEQTCAAVGALHCEIKLYGSDRRLITSGCFLLSVADTVYREGDEVSSEGEMTTLDALICDASALIADMEQLLQSGGGSGSRLCYVATDYGVNPENADNTAAMQQLIDTVHDHGGGIIWLPIGEYRFDSANSVPENADFRTILTPKSGVSIVGESLSGTVIRVYGHTEKGASWLANYIANRDDKSVKLSGCTYRNFTIDMSEATVAEYSSTGKALGMKALRDCIFRDLRLLETPSTALGIDMLDNVVIDSVYVYKGGREWQPGGQGGAGIGIGTGKWENENYVIRNCLCVECGHFGIFLEDQGIFSGNHQQNDPEGLTITNNVIRNGRNYGIGVRGGRNVIITGNNLYGNKGGIYLDYGTKNVLASNNVIADCTEAGVLFGIEDAGHGNYPCEGVAVFGNSFFDNKLGISIMRKPVNTQFETNIFIGNHSNMPVEIPIEESRIKQGVYINDAGEEAANARSWLYDAFIDLDTTLITWIPIGETETGGLKNPRIAIYDENQVFLHRINGDYQPDQLKTIIEEALTAAGKSTNFRYIKFGDNCSGEILTTLQLYVLE